MDVGGDQVGKGSAFYLKDFAGKLDWSVIASMLPWLPHGSNRGADRK